MKKKYTLGEIARLSLGQLNAKYGAELSGADGGSSTEGLPVHKETDTALMAEDKLNRLMALAAGDSAENERLYTYYRNRYADGASLAAKNAYGLAAANTGGYGSTYASAVAGSAYEKYMSGLYDKLENINSSTFNKIADFAENAAKHGDYSFYEALGADMSAAKQGTAFAQAENRAKYGDYSELEALGVDTGALRHGEQREAAEQAAKYGDYSGLEAMGVDTTLLRYNGLLELAEKMAKYGDYSGLNTMGVDTTLLRYNELLELAAEMAKYGDYSGLEALGVNTERIREAAALEKALALAKYGDFSLLGDYSSNLSGLRSKISVTIQKGAQTAYDNDGYAGLLRYLNRQIGYGQINEQEKKRILSVVTGS